MQIREEIIAIIRNGSYQQACERFTVKYCVLFFSFQMFVNQYSEPPLVALTYLTGQCNYGGRVTDDRDRRLIISILKIFYCSEVISDDDYKFSTSGQYYAPKTGEHEKYVEYIRSLPLIPHPEVIDLYTVINPWFLTDMNLALLSQGVKGLKW